MNTNVILAMVAMLLLLTACDDETVIGENLLGGDEIDTATSDEYKLKARTIEAGAIQTRVDRRGNTRYYVGELEDPVFGTYSSDAYVAFKYEVLPDFSDSTIDSLVLVMEYDSLGTYGDTEAVHSIAVERVLEDFEGIDSIDSGRTFETGSLLGTAEVVINARDSVVIDSRTNPGESIKLAPQLRIRLDDALGAELLADSIAAESNEALVEAFKGVRISATANGVSTIPFQMDSTSFTSLVMYYTQADTIKRAFGYPIRPDAFAHFAKDHTGTPVAAFIGDEVAGDSLLFMQAQKGLDIEFTMPTLTDLREVLINKATLTLTVADLSGDWPVEQYPNIQQLVASTLAGDESMPDTVLVEDLTRLELTNALILLGGSPEETMGDNGESLIQYELNITEYIQDIVDDQQIESKLILSPLLRQESVRNTVFFGPGSSKYPAKLRITYTKL